MVILSMYLPLEGGQDIEQFQDVVIVQINTSSVVVSNSVM